MNRANPTKGTKKIRTGSIARRINTAQAWRRFCRGVFLTVLITVLIAGSWCLLIEWAYGGEITNVSNRRFGGSFNWHENLIDLRNQNGLGAELKKYIRENDPLDLKLNTPFDGIEYRFNVTVPVEEYLQTAAGSQRVQQVELAQQSVEKYLRRAKATITVEETFSVLMNGFAVRGPYSMLQTLRQIPLIAAEGVERLTTGELFVKVLGKAAMAR